MKAMIIVFAVLLSLAIAVRVLPRFSPLAPIVTPLTTAAPAPTLPASPLGSAPMAETHDTTEAKLQWLRDLREQALHAGSEQAVEKRRESGLFYLENVLTCRRAGDGELALSIGRSGLLCTCIGIQNCYARVCDRAHAGS